MKVKFLQRHRRTFFANPLPQCEKKRITKYWNDEHNKQYQCQRQAIVEIDGMNLCSQHGGAIALVYLANRSS